MWKYGLCIPALGLLLTMSGCRDFGPLEGTVDVEWEPLGGTVFSRVAPGPGNRLYGIPADRSGRLLRSEDGGLTWEEELSVQPYGYTALEDVIAFGPDGEVYAMAYIDPPGPSLLDFRPFVRLGDEGWQELGQLWTARAVTAYGAGSDGTVFVGTEGPGPNPQGMYGSVDRASSWTQITPLITTSRGGGILNGSLAFGPDGLMLAYKYDNQSSADQGLYRSISSGRTWGLLPPPDYALRAVHITGDEVVYAAGVRSGGGTIILLSNDLGESWSEVEVLESTSDVYGFAPNARVHLYLAAGPGGVLRSATEGRSWEPINEGFPLYQTGGIIGQVMQVFIGPEGRLYANTGNGLYRSKQRVE